MAGLDMGKKIGPLPLGAWIGATAGGVAIAYAINRKRKGAPTTAQADAAATATPSADPLGGAAGMGGVVSLPNGAGASGAGVAGGGVASSLGNPTFTDNDSWAGYVTSILVAKGYGALAVTKALQDFQGGVQLDSGEQAIIDLAIRFAGAPPTAVPPITAAPAPTATAPGPASGGISTAVRTLYKDGGLHTFYLTPGPTLPGYGGTGAHLIHEWIFKDGTIHTEDLSNLLHLGPISMAAPPVVNANGPDGFLHVDIVGIDGKHNDIYWNGSRWVQRVLV